MELQRNEYWTLVENSNIMGPAMVLVSLKCDSRPCLSQMSVLRLTEMSRQVPLPAAAKSSKHITMNQLNIPWGGWYSFATDTPTDKGTQVSVPAFGLVSFQPLLFSFDPN